MIPSISQKAWWRIYHKGGEGSGSWNGPGDPRFAHEAESVLRKLKTGDAIEITLHRGAGTTDHRTASQFAVDEYWSPHREVARTYGTNIRTEKIRLENPYVFTLPKKQAYFDELKAEFGTHDAQKITDKLVKAGHDSLVVRNVPMMRGSLAIADTIEVILFSKRNIKGEDVGHPFRGNQYTSSESTAAEGELDSFLTQLNNMVGAHTPANYVYKSRYDMVLKDGRNYIPQKLPIGLTKQRDKECYANAGRLALDNPKYTYVEGYATIPGIGFPVEHAWCVDKAGRVIDNTWNTPGTAYRGIAFNTEFLRKTILQTETWGLIPDMPRADYNPMRNGFPTGAIAKKKSLGILSILKGGAGSGNFGHAGRPGEVGGSGDNEGETVYHGTLRDAPDWNQPGYPVHRLVDKILKEGITVQNHMANPLEGRVPSKVYATKNSYAATDFAWMAAHNALAHLPEDRVSDVALAIFHIHVPKDTRLEADIDSDAGLQAYQFDKIPPEWIKGYEILTYHRAHDEIGDREYHKVKEVSSDIYYVPVVLGLVKQKEKCIGIFTLIKGGAGSGSWDGPGQPRFAREDNDTEGKRSPSKKLAERLMSAAQEGGFTLDFRTEKPVTDGFAVGVFPHRSGVFDIEKVTAKDVHNWLSENKGKLNDKRLKVGGWVDEGKLWLDIVRVYNAGDKDLAIRVGSKKNQIAIADLGAIKRGDWDNAFINTGGTGKSVKKGKRKPVMMLFDNTVTAGEIISALKQDKQIGICTLLKGGPGSGNFGHAGRPGEVGGSGEGGSAEKDNAVKNPSTYTGTPRMGMGDTSIPPITEFRGGSAEKHIMADGKFTPERQALHDKIVWDHIKNITPSGGKPVYYMMGGGTASGKSTMLDKVGLPDNIVKIDSDKIKELLGEERNLKWAAYTHDESSYVAKRVAQAAFETGRDALLDGTGNSSMVSLMGKINAAVVNGYDVHGIYATNSIDTALKWEQQRAERTGRKVPAEVLIEKHTSISKLLPQVVGAFTTLRLYDTEGGTRGATGAHLIMEANKGKVTIHDKEAYQRFLDKANYKMKSIESISDERKEKLLIAIGLGKSPKETAKNKDELEYCNIMAAAKKRTEDEGYIFDIPFEIPDVDKVK